MASLDRLLYLLTTPVTNDKNNKEDQRKNESKKLRIGEEIKMGVLGRLAVGPLNPVGWKWTSLFYSHH